MGYAEGTSVSVEKSRAEIERTLSRYGADQFLSGWEADRAMIAFRVDGRHVRINLKLPPRDDDRFLYSHGGKRERTATQVFEAWEKECRRLWRALNLVIKAKLEAVDSGISSFDEEFLASIMMPDGRTVSEDVIPKILEAYETGNLPPLLEAPKRRRR